MVVALVRPRAAPAARGRPSGSACAGAGRVRTESCGGLATRFIGAVLSSLADPRAGMIFHDGHTHATVGMLYTVTTVAWSCTVTTQSQITDTRTHISDYTDTVLCCYVCVCVCVRDTHDTHRGDRKYRHSVQVMIRWQFHVYTYIHMIWVLEKRRSHPSKKAPSFQWVNGPMILNFPLL